MNAAKVIQRLCWGVDFKILNLCTEEKVRFIKYEIVILFICGLSTWAFISFANNVRLRTAEELAILLGLIELISYKFYLSNLHLTLFGKSSGFAKWLLSTIFAISTAYCLTTGVFDVSLDLRMSIVDMVVAGITLIVSFILFYIPVRFNEDKNSQYAKLIKQAQEEEAKWAELTVTDLLQKETKKRKAQSEIDKKAELIYTDLIAQEIAKSRLRVAKEVLVKWEKKQKTLIQTNIDEYIVQK